MEADDTPLKDAFQTAYDGWRMVLTQNDHEGQPFAPRDGSKLFEAFLIEAQARGFKIDALRYEKW